MNSLTTYQSKQQQLKKAQSAELDSKIDALTKQVKYLESLLTSKDRTIERMQQQITLLKLSVADLSRVNEPHATQQQYIEDGKQSKREIETAVRKLTHQG